MDPRYQAMMFGGQGFGGVGGENIRRRPASLLLDESPLKITLRINSLKVVAKEKDQSDAISALANKIESARVAEEEEGEDEVEGVDSDGDGVDDWTEETLVGTDPNDPDDTPTPEQIRAAKAADEATAE